MKIKVFSIYLKFTSAAIILILLYASSACSMDSDDKSVPMGTFNVNGTIVEENEENTPISGAKVELGLPYLQNEDTLIYYVTSFTTGNKGTFNLDITEYPQPQKFKLKIEDTYEEKRFESIIRTVDFINPSFTGGNGGWYAGETFKDMGLIKISLKKSDKANNNPDETIQ